MLGGFSNVEGVDLRLRGKDPVVTPVDKLGVPTYDELVLVAQRERLEEDPEAIRLFLGGAGPRHRGRRQEPRRATEALLAANPDLDPKLTRAEVDATLPLLAQQRSLVHERRAVGGLHRLDARQRADLLRPAPSEVLSNAYLPGRIPE